MTLSDSAPPSKRGRKRRVGAQQCLLVALWTYLAIAYGGDIAAAENAPQPLVLEATIPLEKVSGRIDHMAIDVARRRLWVAELGNNAVDVVDVAEHKALHRIEGLSEPQGIGFSSATDTIVVANGGDGSLAFYGAGDFAPAGRINLGDDADNVRIDGQSGHAIVGYGQGALAIVDLASKLKLSEVPLVAHPEGFQLSADGARAFVNVPDARQVAVVDIHAGKQTATWALTKLRSNFPMAMNSNGTTLALVFRRPSHLVLLNIADGSTGAEIETCGDADDVFFDAKRNRVYVSCGQGYVDVFDQGNGGLQSVNRLETISGARTALFVPELDRLFVAAPGGLIKGSAKILVYRPEKIGD